MIMIVIMIIKKIKILTVILLPLLPSSLSLPPRYPPPLFYFFFFSSSPHSLTSHPHIFFLFLFFLSSFSYFFAFFLCILRTPICATTALFYRIQRPPVSKRHRRYPRCNCVYANCGLISRTSGICSLLVAEAASATAISASRDDVEAA